MYGCMIELDRWINEGWSWIEGWTNEGWSRMDG